ncbi:MAG: hypothetical protein ABSH13_18690 [Candidatus Acidiferrum sp.]|jgi:hypothetical protein
MRIRSIFLGAVAVAAMTFGAAAPQYGQNAPAPGSDADSVKHTLAINLLRTINTAEADHKFRYGTYANWDDLLMNRDLAKCAEQIAAQLGAHLSKGPEIFPGWTLRLNLTNGGQGYDLLLEDTTDKPCRYAAGTDERGLIRQSKVIDCPI